jgi:hypothetical protein
LTSFASLLPAIVVNGNYSELIMNRCEIKGHKEKETGKNNLNIFLRNFILILILNFKFLKFIFF